LRQFPSPVADHDAALNPSPAEAQKREWQERRVDMRDDYARAVFRRRQIRIWPVSRRLGKKNIGYVSSAHVLAQGYECPFAQASRLTESRGGAENTGNYDFPPSRGPRRWSRRQEAGQLLQASPPPSLRQTLPNCRVKTPDDRCGHWVDRAIGTAIER